MNELASAIVFAAGILGGTWLLGHECDGEAALVGVVSMLEGFILCAVGGKKG